MSISRLNWGILSTGKIAETLARALGESETGHLLAVASRQSDTARDFAQRCGVERSYPEYEALLADPDVDVVYVATPHPWHAEWAVKAAEAGKHVLCEKPSSVNHAGLMAMLEAARKHNVFFMEAFMYRCHPQTARLLELLRGGAVGNVQMIEATFSFRSGFNPASRLYNNALAGGGILDVGCYTVSMARLVAGAAVGAAFDDPVDVKGTAHLGETGVDEWATASLRFSSGILAQVTCGVGLSLPSVVRITGTEGCIELPNPWQASRAKVEPGRIRLQRRGEKEVEDMVVSATHTSFVYEVDLVGRAIPEGKLEAPPPAMTWLDSEGNLKTLDSWRRSVGLVFEMERPGRVETVTRRPLAVDGSNRMKFGSVPGLEKPVSRLVMGCDNQATFPHACVIFDDFIERGGNCFDTAFVYGNGLYERHLGAWIKDRGIRKDVVVIGKGAHTPYCFPEVVSVQLGETLNRLQTDHVDLYLLHRDNPEVPAGEFVEALNRELRAGRVRAFGGSNWSLERVGEANAYARDHGLVGFSAVSNNFSLARMVDPVWGGCIAASDASSRRWLGEHRVPLFAWSSQARGFFTERSGPDRREDSELVRCWYSDDNFERKRRVVVLARQKGVLPINIALAYVLQQPFTTFALIGPRTLRETDSSFDGLGVDLSEAERRWLNLEIDS